MDRFTNFDGHGITFRLGLRRTNQPKVLWLRLFFRWLFYDPKSSNAPSFRFGILILFHTNQIVVTSVLCLIAMIRMKRHFSNLAAWGRPISTPFQSLHWFFQANFPIPSPDKVSSSISVRSFGMKTKLFSESFRKK